MIRAGRDLNPRPLDCFCLIKSFTMAQVLYQAELPAHKPACDIVILGMDLSDFSTTFDYYTPWPGLSTALSIYWPVFFKFMSILWLLFGKQQLKAVFEPGSKPRQGFMLGHYTTRAYLRFLWLINHQNGIKTSILSLFPFRRILEPCWPNFLPIYKLCAKMFGLYGSYIIKIKRINDLSVYTLLVIK